jgi:pimeloyl-ACP methyl ester carboxylesterase
MKRILLALLLLMIVKPERSHAQRRFEAVPCPESLDSGMECGYITVPEDHADPNGKQIRLMVAIAHATGDDPLPDPVVVLVGGPGGAAVGSHAETRLEAAIRARRDVIYLDQRGTGLSEPNLNCPELESTLYEDAAYLDGLQACRNRLVADGISLTAYTTAQNAADVVKLREILGYDSWNLWGTSYGTRLALEVMRLDPDGIRSVVLDSVSPPNAEPDQDRSSQPLEQLFDKCESDSLCNLVYPHLRDIYFDLYARLNTQPVEITNPQTGLPFMLDGAALKIGMFELLSDPAVTAMLPAIIYDFHNGDFSALEGLLHGLSGEVPTNGLAFSVMCSDQTMNSVVAEPVCSIWFADEAPTPQNHEAVISDIPVLLLAGEIDPYTPSQWAYRAAETLDHSYVYTYSGVGHVALLGGSCPQTMMMAFLDDPNLAPDDSCITGMPDIAFVVTAPATRPWARASAGVLGVLAALILGMVGWQSARHPRQFAWIASLRLMGWLSIGVSVGGFALMLAVGQMSRATTLRLVELIVPLAMALQASFVFSPAENPPLEVLLSCPRRPFWILVERFAVLFAVQTGLALVGTVITLAITGGDDLILAVLRWIPPALMLTGIATFVVIRSRVAVFAAGLTLLIWFFLIMLGDALLPGHLSIYPLNYIQPWWWPFHPYLKPGSMSAGDYLTNRIVVASVGIVFLAWAARHWENSEMMIVGSPARKETKRWWFIKF